VRVVLNCVASPVLQIDSVTVPVSSREFSNHAKIVCFLYGHYTEKNLSVIGQSPWKMQVSADRVVREISQKWI